MCESNVYLIRDGKEELVLADVASIEPKGDCFVLEGLLGNRVELKAKLVKLDLMAHKILFTKTP
jgi:predicted RNA-binding protein